MEKTVIFSVNPKKRTCSREKKITEPKLEKSKGTGWNVKKCHALAGQ